MPASKAQQAKTAARRTRAIALRVAGLPWHEIADRLDYAGPAAARVDVDRALDATRADLKAAADELRTLELMRLDRLQAAIWQAAMSGDIKAVEAARRIIESRRRLMGLDAPIKVDARVTDEVSAEIADLLDQMSALDVVEQQQAIAREEG